MKWFVGVPVGIGLGLVLLALAYTKIPKKWKERKQIDMSDMSDEMKNHHMREDLKKIIKNKEKRVNRTWVVIMIIFFIPWFFSSGKMEWAGWVAGFSFVGAFGNAFINLLWEELYDDEKMIRNCLNNYKEKKDG